MNIRVDLTTPIKDGTEVVFRSPVDCSQITGLIVYVTENGNTTSQEFALADAHGNNVGDIDHLFAENVVVKVILDVANSMAFVQNADTNAYLEGRFADIIDKLCPSFEKTGTVVQCEPVEGYPLSVQAKEDGHVEGVTVTVCGKNLYDAKTYPLKKDLYIHMNTGTCNQPSSTSEYRYAATATDLNKPLYIPVGHLVGKVITLNNIALGASPGMAFYDSSKKRIAGGKGNAITVPTGAAFMSFTINAAVEKDIQIEIGSAETAYEPYLEKTFEASGDAASEFIQVDGVFGRSGVMTFFAKNGKGEITDVKVSGKADPVALIDKLTEAVRSLGGDV